MHPGAQLVFIALLLVASAASPRDTGADDAGTEKELQARLVRDPADAQARLLLGQALVARGAIDEAYDVVAPMLETRGEQVRPHLAAEIQLRLGELSRARKACTLAVMKQESAYGRCQLGRIYLAERQYALAISQFHRARTLGFPGVELHVGLASAYYYLGNYLGTLRMVMLPIGPAPALMDDVYLIEPLPQPAGAFLAASAESAIYHLERAIALGADQLDLHLMRGGVWLETERFARAAMIYADIEPRIASSSLTSIERAEYYERFARSLYGSDKIDASVDAYRQAVRLDPQRWASRLAEVYRQAAQRFVQRGDLPRYIEFMQLAVSEDPDSADLHYRLGNAYWEAGRNREAARHWRMALQIEPEHPDRRRLFELIQSIAQDAHR